MVRACLHTVQPDRKSSTLDGMESWLGILGMQGLELLVLRAWGWAVE